jgi:DNA (cytosine-5)-methyltransferase 1
VYRAVSLFSGCGGMDLGFTRAGFRVVRAIDSDPAAVAAYRGNLGPAAEAGDVTLADFTAWRRETGPVDLVLGGFPCQGFSKSGPKRAGDPRNRLYQAMRDAVQALAPACFVAENVEGLAQNFSGHYLRLISQDFARLGYQVSIDLVDAAGFGVPQHRRRIFFTGLRDGGLFHWPAPAHAVPVRNGEASRARAMATDVHGAGAAGRPAPCTVRDALAGLPEPPGALADPDHQVLGGWPERYEAIIKAIGPGQKLCNVRHGPESVRTWDIPQAFGPVTGAERDILETIARHRRLLRYGTIPNGNPLPVAEIERLTGRRGLEPVLADLARRGFTKRKNGGYDLLGALFCSGLFKRPGWNAPSPTVLTTFGSPRYFLHPDQDRPFTLREAARLQGFPDGFGFAAHGVSLRDGFRLVGNAVPPPLAYALARALRARLAAGR